MVIVAAVDRTERAQSVIEQATSLAEAFDDTIHVVHVLTSSEFLDLEQTNIKKTGSAIDSDRISAVAEEIAEQAATDLEWSHEIVGLRGEAAERIVDYADEQDARYIVIASRKRSPAGKVIFGSDAHSILVNANTPVVISNYQISG